MGILMYNNENYEISKIKQLKMEYLDKLNQKWYSLFSDFTMITEFDNNKLYNVSTIIKLFDDGFPVIKQDSQTFNAGQELELLEYVEYINYNFIIHNTHVSVRTHTNDIVESVMLGVRVDNIQI